MGPFTTRDLFACMALLQTLQRFGVQSIEEALGQIKARLPVPPDRVGEHSDGSASLRACPSCGHGILVPVANTEGLLIVGCKRCRYSEVQR